MNGKIVSHYKILEKLGEGGMGVVYKAEDTKLKRTVALKFLPPELTRDEEAKKRFLHEARAAATLDHPNICTIHEIGETEDGQMFIAMGYYEGQTLKEKIATGPLPITESINIAIQIAEGLNAAHKKDIVHRDIKSANIIITAEGTAKILDFGLAKLKGQTKLTKEGTTLGTVAYMSPEQASGEESDHRSDIWSLGVLLYEMVTGKVPFKGEYEQAIMYAIMNEQPEPVTGLRSGIPLELERVIDKALSKKISERYQNIEDLMVDLKRLKKSLAKSEPESKQAIQKKVKNTVKSFLIPGFILIMAIIFAGFLVLKEIKKPENPLFRQTDGIEKLSKIQWKNSIAVLPFSNISADKEQQYFCDGMTEDIITKLSYIKDLKVISRTSVMKYKKTEKSIKEIGKELDVENILEGSVRKEKNRIRITAQLIRVMDDAHLWAKNYDRNLESIFAVQDEVSKTIAQVLEVTLTKETIKTFKDGQTRNLKAYEYYLKGMFVFQTRFFISMKDEDFETAKNMLLKSLDIDPDFAKAYNGLVYLHAINLILTRDKKNLKFMKKYADNAIKLDANSAVGYSALGLTKVFIPNFDDSYQLFKKALEINPNDPIINFQIVAFHIGLKLYNKAFEFCVKAMEVDPLFFPSYLTGARCQLYLGNYEECEYYLKKGFEILPNQPILIKVFIRLYLRQKKFNQAKEWLDKLEKLQPESGDLKSLKAILYALKGNKEKALAQQENFRSDEIYSILGMKKKAIDYLQKFLRKNPLRYNYLYLLHSPFYDNLRDSSEFKKIIAKAKKIYEERLKKYGDL